MFKHFHPAFRDVDPSLGTASALFMAFAFRKPAQQQPAPQTTQHTPGSASAAAAGSGTHADRGVKKRPSEQAEDADEQPPSKRRVATGPALKRPTIKRRGGKLLDHPPDKPPDKPPASTEEQAAGSRAGLG